ncbi:UNVERIFIED_CONTAM: ribonuclease T2-like [Siphonaria sp. JEL0065]|nr:ribonuclease T2-like [Siphonaria sp. JEL0065]
MKFTSILALAFVATVKALPLDALFARAASCDANSVGCQGNTDLCCVPTNGELVLSLQWLPGWCAMNTCSSGVIAAIPPGTWTIHGLWPDTCTGAQTGKVGCDSTRQYSSIDALISSSSIYRDMNKYWISYKGADQSASDAFWVHEWGVHGTCYSPANTNCVGSSGSADVLKFFGDVLKTHKTYDLYTPLYNAGVVPNGNSYDKSLFTNAILAAFPGMSIGYVCSGAYVNEIHLSLIAVGGGLVGKPSDIVPETDNCPQRIVYAAPPGGNPPPPSTTATTSVSIATTSSTKTFLSTTVRSSTTTTSSNLQQCAPLLCSPGNLRNSLAAPCNSCVSAIGAVDSHCTKVGWNKMCVSEVTSVCRINC